MTHGPVSYIYLCCLWHFILVLTYLPNDASAVRFLEMVANEKGKQNIYALRTDTICCWRVEDREVNGLGIEK